MTQNKYIRLSLVLLVPLLITGWWLSEKEVIIPHHYFFSCGEFDSHISCAAIVEKEGQIISRIKTNGAVTLSRVALLERGLHHHIVTVNVSTPLFVGHNVVGPANGGARKMLSLPPPVTNEINSVFMSCNIEPMPDSEKNWVYACFKGEPEAFKFADESANRLFRQAVADINRQAPKYEDMAIRARLVSFFLPLFSYAIISLLFIALAKLSKFVVHGRKP